VADFVVWVYRSILARLRIQATAGRGVYTPSCLLYPRANLLWHVITRGHRKLPWLNRPSNRNHRTPRSEDHPGEHPHQVAKGGEETLEGTTPADSGMRRCSKECSIFGI
jgi:hypothetical protein